MLCLGLQRRCATWTTWAPAALVLLACAGGGRTAASPAERASDPAVLLEGCAELGGSFRFDGLATSCRVTGSLRQLPVYPIEAAGRPRGPRTRDDFLPLPLAHWADAGSTLVLAQDGCSKLTLELHEGAGAGSAATPYHRYELPAGELRQHGRLEWSARHLSFEGEGSWEGWQLPLGISRVREGWSFALDDAGRLHYLYRARETSAMLWVVPWRRSFEVDCLLPAGGIVK